MSEFYRNMKILSLDLYKKTAALSNSSTSGSGVAASGLSAGGAAGGGGGGNFASFSLANSRSKGALPTLGGLGGRGKKSLLVDPTPFDPLGKMDLAALALESPSGTRLLSQPPLPPKFTIPIIISEHGEERVHDHADPSPGVLQRGELDGADEALHAARERTHGLLGEVRCDLPAS